MVDQPLALMLGATIYSVWEAAVICGGVCLFVATVGATVYVLMREDSNRPVLPWGLRMKVERAKALLELDTIEVKRIAVEHQRTMVLEAVKDGDTEQVAQLALGAAKDQRL